MWVVVVACEARLEMAKCGRLRRWPWATLGPWEGESIAPLGLPLPLTVGIINSRLCPRFRNHIG
ncbi:hypothetical protein BJ508DRAFT_834 [Ascobolus immersus RN42]|uniref:Uncharacterized protein n=1 Tax=Ascobolus immersus RN42 TaxID=1160509 RepID=A0A3N4IQA0_ASCIM|nr:hypothetical protein BJ508DRAFT_834 [Ascobolus immersus RN42]